MPNKSTHLARLYAVARERISRAYDVNELLVYLTMYVPPLLALQRREIGRFARNRVPCTSVLNGVSSIMPGSDSEGNVSVNLDLIREAVRRSRECALNDLADVLELFFVSAIQFRADPPPPSYCHYTVTAHTCMECGMKGDYLSWRVVNTWLRDDLRHMVTTGKAFANRCHYCGRYVPYVGPLIYCNPNDQLYLLFCPPLNEPDQVRLQEEVSRYLDSLPGDFRENKSKVAFVSKYVSGSWRGADDVNLVFYVHDIDEFLRISSADTMRIRVVPDPLQTVRYENAGFNALANKDWKLAILMYAKAFLETQNHTEYLIKMAAAMAEMGLEENARSLRECATRLEQRLEDEGVVRTIRVGLNDQEVGDLISLSHGIQRDGLPAEWGFAELVATVRDIAREYDSH